MSEKLRPENPGQKLQIRPENPGLSGPWRETFYIPMPEKLRPENPSKKQQIPPENPAASNSRNGRKIPAINYRYGWKIPASKNRYGRKILRPVTKETAGKSLKKDAVAQWKSIWSVICNKYSVI
jgi:hypothetical protein